MDARIDLTRKIKRISPFYKRPYDKTGPDEIADAIAILQAITPSPDCSCAEYAGDDTRCKTHGDLYDKYGEQEQQARECEEIEDKFGHMSEPFVDDWSLPGYDYEGSDNTMRGSRMDAGYGEMGPL